MSGAQLKIPAIIAFAVTISFFVILAVFLSSASQKKESARVRTAVDVALEIQTIYESPVIQVEVTDLDSNGRIDTFEYESMEVAAGVTDYPDSLIVQKIFFQDTLNGYEFISKRELQLPDPQ